MDDKVLRQLVIDELDYEPSIEAANIGVTAENGVVTLTGHVGSYIEKATAEQVVRQVRGVRAVAEEIEVRYPYQKKVEDDQIARRALDIIGWDTSLPEDRVTVKVEKGWVTLSGTVDWYFQKQAAEAAVRRLGGVIGVLNRIDVKPKLQPKDVKDKILAALRRNADLEAEGIDVRVAGDKVTLEGKVRGWSDRALVERAAWSAPGVRAVDDRLNLG